ncbi:hypothetical protein BBB56_12780 [Candidatus Pantoea deserta]|uniref:Uncharacterized protein n=1 Tax=Candidatus Pantoea deserta TaxID=1869313 RepID=A0A3N4P7M7_9GAMM|nr:hypothetical protein BBB56_12780 [Pantoea deserta]
MRCNALLKAFNDPTQFIDGIGVDGVYLHFHKANEFTGLQAMPTFIANDVVKILRLLMKWFVLKSL